MASAATVARAPAPSWPIQEASRRTLLASLFQQAAAKGTQVIVATQSAALLNEFKPEDIVVVDRAEGQSRFRRLGEKELKVWLEDDYYPLGDLWEKNVFGGGPVYE